MAISVGSGRGSGSPIAAFVRRGAFLLGAGVLLGGVAWMGVSLLHGPVASFEDSPEASFTQGAATQCVAPWMRRALERESCSHWIRLELLEGTVGLDEAVRRLESCSDRPPETEVWFARQAALSAERVAAASAFETGIAAAARLRRAGMGPTGFLPDDYTSALAELRASARLRSDFREVFGSLTADDLERLLGASDPTTGAAVVVGNGVVLREGGMAAPGPGTEAASPLVVLSIADYTDRVVDGFQELEVARLRYLASAGERVRHTGSMGSVISSFRSGEADERPSGSVRRAAADRQEMLQRFADLERGLGLDPALLALGRVAVGSTLELSHACQAAAAQRHTRVRAGAGLAAGLAGGAVMVMAAGAAGTVGGGVVIAAALHAVGGGYVAFRSERRAVAERDPARRRIPDPTAEEEPFRRPDAPEGQSGGAEGQGQGERREWDGAGDRDEAGAGEGTGEEFEADDPHSEPKRRNTIPARLPPPLPDGAVELPPMLDSAAFRALERISLSEARERIDEFLGLGSTREPEAQRQAELLRASGESELIEEAREALGLWVESRELSPGFGGFFLRVEVEDVPRGRRAGVLQRASDRYARDRAALRGSVDLEDLRERVAQRLVIHCRGGDARGDLMLQACSDPTALALVIVAAIRDAGLTPPDGAVLGVQARGGAFEPVLFHPDRRDVESLSSGAKVQGVAAPIYHPASFYYSFLVERGVRPAIDAEAHLLIVRADPGMEAGIEECAEARRGLARAVDWIRSLLGLGVPSRRGTGCGTLPGGGARAGEGETEAEGGPRSGVHATISRPGLPRPTGGGGQGGGSGSRGSGGGGSAGASGGSSGGSGGGDGGDGSGSARSGTRAGSSGGATRGVAPGGGAAQGGEAGGTATGGAGGGGAEGGSAGQGARQDAVKERASAAGDGSGAAGGGSRGRDAANSAAEYGGGLTEGGAGSGAGGAAGTAARSEAGEAGDPVAPLGAGDGSGSGERLDLGRIARESADQARAARAEGAVRFRPWRLQENFTFGLSSGGVYFADSDQALARFRPDDRFITLSPSRTEEQRRMFEADSFPVFAADTDCSTPGLPPRRVFRRATGVGGAFRYEFCGRMESMVVFRARDDAARYARLAPADRPLYLTRLASERIDGFERSAEVATLHAFLRDPDVIRSLEPEEIDSLTAAAGELLWLQETLEGALFLSMHELEGSALRGHYYELHRQVAQSPFILEFVAAVHRFHQRLASDPLRSLAWANALPPEHRQRFFRLYFTLGGPIHWPKRWEALHRRYGQGPHLAPLRASADDEPSLDFLQVTGDPTRVRVDWSEERPPNRASIHDRISRRGIEHTPDQMPEPTEEELRERQESNERRRGGTRGLGRTGQEDGLGPERGRRPLQMIHVRMEPETGEGNRPRLPENNPTRPGGTSGKREIQEESASRQEPVLWLSPRTFVDAILSAWDRPRGKAAEADRVPPVVRFSPRLRQYLLQEPDEDNLYETRLVHAVVILGAGGWSGYREVRDAMGGEWSGVRAFDTGRFAAEFARNAPVVDQDQVRGHSFFTRESIDIPADLFVRVRHSFSRYGTGSFDLQPVPAREPDGLRPSEPDLSDPTSGRSDLMRALRLIAQQSRSRR
jgi:hypothetical protein